MERELRFLNDKERLLDVFHIYADKNLQCLKPVTFMLNRTPTSCSYLQTLKLPENFQLEFEGKFLTETHLQDQITHLASSWMGDFKFSNLPRSYLAPIQEKQSIFHPVVDTLILDDAGEISISKVGGVSGLVCFIIFCSCAICLWKIPTYRNWVWNVLTKMIQQCYRGCTSKTYREEKENIALKRDVTAKKEMLLKNIEDFNLIKKFEDSLNPLPEVQSLPAALDKVVGFKALMWSKLKEVVAELTLRAAFLNLMVAPELNKSEDILENTIIGGTAEMEASLNSSRNGLTE